MSTVFDPDVDWLVSCNRALAEYVAAAFDPDLVTVEMNFPDTLHLLPLETTLIHFEQDDMDHPVLGFGTPGKEVFTPSTGPGVGQEGTWLIQEAVQHVVNFDMGVWASAQSGGATHRMKVMQTLSNLFAPAVARLAFREATGMQVVSFAGGRNELDRLNDTPVWRALDMTLVLRVFSRHTPATPEIVPDDIDQTQQLTTAIQGTGAQAPV